MRLTPTRREWALVALIIGLPACAYVACEIRWARLNSPDGKFTTLNAFLNSEHPPERVARIKTDAGTYHIGYGSMKGTWLAVPSGPPAYVFDESGALVYYSAAIGDDSRFLHEWPAKSQEDVSFQELQSMKLQPNTAPEPPPAAEVRSSAELLNTNPESKAPTDGDSR